MSTCSRQNEKLIEGWKAEEEKPFTGWDFSYLDGRMLLEQPQWPDATPQKYAPLMRAAGLSVVDVQEWSGRLVFTDVGAIVYYLKAVPWLVPGFTVGSHTANLMALQKQILSRGELVYEARNYLMEAAKA